MKWLNVIKNLNIFKRKKANLPKQPIQQEQLPKETLNFTLQVAKHAIQQGVSENQNVVCSPASIDVVLSILAVGSKNSTLEQLLKVLGRANVEEVNQVARKLSDVLKGGSEDGEDVPVISSVNALWLDGQFSLNDMFQKVLKELHNAEARAVDFKNQPYEVVNEANSWAENETKGLIRQFLTRNDIKDDTVLLLANALYFKGTWHYSFNPELSQDGYFTLLDRAKVRVPFMNQYYQYFGYATFDGFRVLRMHYKRGLSTKSYSMFIFLPNENDGLPNVVENIKIDENLFNLDYVLVGTLSIPKFNFESHIQSSLKESMKQLGLTLPFEETCSDLSGIMDSRNPIYVSNMIQKCYVETTEQGSEAAAVTWETEEVGDNGFDESPPPAINFVADHPFMFMIREDVSGAVLFVGSMLNPM